MREIQELRNFREGRTLKAAAKLFDVNKSTFLRWEEGAVLIPADRVVEVERITGISRHILRPDLSKIFIDPSLKSEAAA